MRYAWVAVVVAFFCYLIVQAPGFFTLDEVIVNGIETLSSQQVEEIAGVFMGEHLLRLNPKKTAERLLASPQIASAIVRRVWPNQLEITVIECIGFAVIPFQDVFLEVDRWGVVVSVVQDFSRVNLPIITGVPVVETSLGKRIVGKQMENALLVAVNLPDKLRSSISEIHMEVSGEVSLVTTGGIIIRLGNANSLRGRLALIPTVLYAYEEKGMSRDTVAYIDMTGEVPVYRGK